MIAIVVAYATPQRQEELWLSVDDRCTVREAIVQSGILARFPEIDLTRQPVGVDSKKTTLEAIVRQGQRVEIYRPLTVDPKQARLRRAAKARF